MDAVESTTAEGWHDLQELLYAGAWRDEIGRFRSPFAFRGIGDAAHATLHTSLMRLGGDAATIERHLLRNFRKYAYRDRDAWMGDSTWEWLALAQHHGLPTRLLDWTYSPYVALHFATEDLELFEHDAAVWCVNFEAAHRLLPDILARLLTAEGSNVFTAEMLRQAAIDLFSFDALTPDPFVLFFEPPSLDARIVNQYALFSLMSNPAIRFDEWLAGHPRFVRRIVIPARLKWEVRDKLDQANITERVLFPGLDGLSKWLKRHYVPRAPLRPAASPVEPGQAMPAGRSPPTARANGIGDR